MVRNTFETELNGKKIGFRCSTYAIAIACREAKVKTVNELIARMGEQDLLSILALFYGSAIEYFGSDEGLTMSVVGDWIEEMGEVEAQRATTILLQTMIPKNPSPPRSGAKKRKVKNR